MGSQWQHTSYFEKQLKIIELTIYYQKSKDLIFEVNKNEVNLIKLFILSQS